MVISVGIVNEHEIVVAGIRAVLTSYSRRVRLRGTGRRATEVDVLLYDPTTDPRGTSADTLLWQNHGRLIAIGWELDSAQVRATMPIGVEGYISLQLSPAELVDAIERAHRGELDTVDETRGTGETLPDRWLGDERVPQLAARRARLAQ